MKQSSYRFLFDVQEANDNRVFYDPSRVRGKRVRRLFLTCGFIFFAWIGVFFGTTLSMSAIVDELSFWWNLDELKEVAQRQPGDLASQQQVLPEQLIRASFASTGDPEPCLSKPRSAFAAYANANTKAFVGHIPTKIEWAPLSLKKSCDTLSVLVPDWISIETSKGVDANALNVALVDDSVREPVDTYREASQTPPILMPTVTIEFEEQFDENLPHLAKTGVAKRIADDLVASATKIDAKGLCLDFKQLNAEQLASISPFFTQFSSTLKDANLMSCIVLSERQDVWKNSALMKQFDRVILKAFQEPWLGSPPGPVAAEEWFRELANQAVNTIGQDRLTIAIGNFAAAWTTRQPLPETLPVVEAWKRIDDAKATLRFSSVAGNGFSSYRDAKRRSHKLWLLDAVSAHNQIKTLESLGIYNIAIWSLGNEDPGLWQVLAQQTSAGGGLPQGLENLHFDNYVSYQGEGSFLRVVGQPRDGRRELEIDPTSGRISNVKYVQFPRPYELERYGRPAANKLVLTFDDGPDPVYTSAILDTLKDTNTPGSFFVVGTRVMEEPDLLNRMVSEGHEIGAHTFSHPRMDLISQARSELEHGMSERVIAGYSGRETLLYREPFQRAGGPIEASRVLSLEKVQREGRIISGMEIVPKDWLGLSSTEIADYVISEVNKGAGNVILLHDGGEDRTPSVEALPRIIKELRAQGYEFTTLAELLETDRATLMPAATGRWLLFDRLSFQLLSVTWFSLEAIFWLVLAIGLIRMAFVAVLAILRQRARPISTEYNPTVTVVIPAYNEEKGIVRCIESVLASDYSNFKVVVIDDGSKDETFNEVLRYQRDPRVQIYAQLNQGKWAALNAAIANTDSEVVVCIDADTVIDPQAIGYLARHFCNPRVGAVAGKITVANRGNLLTKLQALEYVTAQNFDRRAYDLVNGIFVVPGAIGAWRTRAIKDAGRYRNDTLTEDADLTIAVNRAGYRVTYEEKAIAFTRAPETVRQLLGQRLRWSLGMFQCTWKHKRAISENRSIGILSIPDMLIFGYLFPLLAPIADAFVLILIYKLFSGTWSGETGVGVSDAPTHLIFAYMILPLLDFMVSAFALKTDQRESMKLLWLFPFQRFFYRQLLYFSVYRSIIRAITGSLAGWGRVSNKKRFQLRSHKA